MMLPELQRYLMKTKRYSGYDDDKWGKLTEGGILLAMTDGPDTRLTQRDFDESGIRLGVQPAAIRAFWETEANSAGFQDGRPKILPERHRFSKLTKGFFDQTNPKYSNPTWYKGWYPNSQDDRYAVILMWAKLLWQAGMPLDAAFAAVSYGAPQIMGENAVICGYPDPFTFAVAMARDEQTQLLAFEAFVTNKRIVPALRKVTADKKTWEPVAAPYNGTGFRLNDYHGKMARNFVKFGGK
jgi:hypothetical protein